KSSPADSQETVCRAREPESRMNALIRVDVLIEDVALARNVAGFFDRAADLIEREMINRSGRRDDVLFDHEASHVIRAEEQGDLADLGTLRYPRRLNVGNVVQIQARDCLILQVLKRAGGRDIGHVRVFGLECPGDECGKSAGLVLELADSLEMLHAFFKRL